jgi:hypothetical protein
VNPTVGNLGLTGFGALLVWSALRGAAVSASLKDVVTGHEPSGTNANPIQDTPVSGNGGNVTSPSGYTSNSAIANDFMSYVGRVPYRWGGATPKGWDCIAENSLVQTSRGAIPIPEVVPGDTVISYQDGKAVTATVTRIANKGIRECIEVRTRNRSIICTPDHKLPVLKKKRDRPYPYEGKGAPSNRWWIEWVSAKDLHIGNTTKGDNIVILSGMDTGGADYPINLMWIAGLFTGDGYMTAKDTRFTVYDDLRDETATAISYLFPNAYIAGGSESSQRKHGLRIISRELRETLIGLGFQNGSHTKRIPESVWLSSSDVRQEFLNGYISADGHHSERHRVIHGYNAVSKSDSLASCNPVLISQARMLAIGLGISVANISVNMRKHPIVINGRTVRNATPLYTFEMYPDTERAIGNTYALKHGASELFQDDYFTCERVKEIRPAGTHRVYDLEVPGPDNFTANGILVHNCSGSLNYVLCHDLGIDIPGYRGGTFTGSIHGPVTGQWLIWPGAVSIPAGNLEPGDLCCWPTHIGVAVGSQHYVSAIDQKYGTGVQPIHGGGPLGEIVMFRRLKAAMAPGEAGIRHKR